MKVLHVLDTSVPDSAGYTTRGYYLTKHQKKLGCKPVILTSERFSNHDKRTEEEIEGIKYYRSQKKTSTIRKIPVLAEIDEVRALSKRLACVVEIEKIDIIHAHSPSLIGSACLDYCKTKNIPLVYEIRAFWEDAAVDRKAFTERSFKYMLRRYHETGVARKADAIIAICDGIKNDLLDRSISEEKIHVVRNGVDCELFRPLAVNNTLKEQLNCSGKTVIGFIGSFFNFEGLQDLILAMKEITRLNSEVVLLLVGKGQVDKELRQLTKEAGLEEKVIFTGRVPHEQVDEFYSIIDVLVYPRIKKRITELVTPLKPLEAMSMEKAVLMSGVGGLRELADVDGVACFFKAGDLADLVQQCNKLCTDHSLRKSLGVAARKYVSELWGWDRRAKEDIDIYQKLQRS